MGKTDVIPFCVADVSACAAFGFIGGDWIWRIRKISPSAERLGGKSGVRRAGAAAGGPALPAHHDDRKDLRPVVGWRDRHDDLADLGRHAAFRSEDRP